MFDALRRRWRLSRLAWNGLRAFQALPASAREIAFYAESAADWAHLGATLDALRAAGAADRIAIATSDPDDPVLRTYPNAFFLGFGTPLTLWFRTLDARAAVMTLPDLETFHLKRSVTPVHYFYIFHSIASIHRVYREHAFDAYDTIFCVGPHHERELRRAEELYHLPPHRLLPHGYARLDRLIAQLADATPPPPLPDGKLRVLLAPTWGESSILEHNSAGLIQSILDDGHHLTLRLHPMTHRLRPDIAPSLSDRFAATGRFAVDPVVSATQALLDADIMISEWSGSILEYAFARLRPVLSIDTPPKIHNPNWAQFNLPCLEDDIRTKIGALLPTSDYAHAPSVLRDLVAHASDWADSIRALRDASVYNIGSSGTIAAHAILDTLSSLPAN